MEQDYKLIEDYLAGNLDKSQIAFFEKRLASDKSFAETFQLQKSMNAFLVKENKKEELLPKLEALGEKHFDGQEATIKPIKRRRIFVGLALAASVAVLIFALNTFFQKPLYQQFADHQALNLIEKGTTEELAQQAQNQFNAKDYTNAYQSLNEYLIKNPNDTKVLLAKGICALELNKYEEAKSIFEKIKNGNSLLKSNGTWYLALTYLKQDNIDQAKIILSEIPESGTFYSEKAKKLRSKIGE